MLHDSNEKLIEIIKKNKPFLVSRIGMGPETELTIRYSKGKSIFKNFPNAGIYSKNREDIKTFYQENLKCFENSDFLACFKCRHWDIVEGYLINKYKIEELKSRILEPFYVCFRK